MLLELDSGIAPTALPGERVLPLPDMRWLVGTGVAGGSLWRLVTADELPAVRHPAWLWTRDEWFDPTFPEVGPTPRAVALRRSLRHAARLTDSTRRTTDLLSAVVYHLRLRWRHPEAHRPLAIVAPRENLARPRSAGRWFVLALISCLPAEISLGLRIACHEPDADPARWDLVLADAPPAGFEVIDAQRPPPIGDDLVAWYVRRRLVEGEPELVEAMAPLWDAKAPDPWEASVERILAQDGPARISLDGDLTEAEVPTARRLVLARLRGSGTVNARLAKEIAAITVRTGDLELWSLLRDRPEDDRSRAFKAWLSVAHKHPPDNRLLEAIAAVRPPHTLTLAWCTGLVRWFLRGNAARVAPGLILAALEADPAEPSLAGRASLFPELVRGLVTGDRALDAVAALLHPAAQDVAARGAGRVLADAWLLVPRKKRTLTALRELVRVLSTGPDGPEAVARLWLGTADEDPTGRAAEAVVGAWALVRASGPPMDRDPVLERIAGTDHATEWVRAIAAHAEHGRLRELLDPAITAGRAGLWAAAEEEWALVHRPSARDRFVALYAYFPEGTSALEHHARELLMDAVATSEFPDNVLADVAGTFADVPDGTTLWMWAAITASIPGQFDEDTIDATVHAFCSSPPALEELRTCGLACTRRLGAAAGWEPQAIARWIVRLILAPDGDRTGYPGRLCFELTAAVAQGPDGLDRLIEITNHLLTLPAEHPALGYFVERVLPELWVDRPPRAFLQRVRIGETPARVRTMWNAALGR